MLARQIRGALAHPRRDRAKQELRRLDQVAPYLLDLRDGDQRAAQLVVAQIGEPPLTVAQRRVGAHRLASAEARGEPAEMPNDEADRREQRIGLRRPALDDPHPPVAADLLRVAVEHPAEGRLVDFGRDALGAFAAHIGVGVNWFARHFTVGFVEPIAPSIWVLFREAARPRTRRGDTVPYSRARRQAGGVRAERRGSAGRQAVGQPRGGWAGAGGAGVGTGVEIAVTPRETNQMPPANPQSDTTTRAMA